MKSKKKTPEITPEAQPKRKRGRPSKYQVAFIEPAKKICKLGATLEEVADILGVSLRAVHEWQNQHEDFAHALKVGTYHADDKVERSLYQRALAGDVTACIFWLKNRRPKEWRDRQEATVDVHMSLAELVALSFREDLPALPPPKHLAQINGDGTKKD